MTDTELVARIEKLERDNRRLKRLGVAALVLVGALGLVAATRPEPGVIKAHAFEVIDGQGRARIKLAATESGEEIWMKNVDGVVTSRLSGDAKGTSLVLDGSGSKAGSAMIDASRDGASLSIFSSEGGTASIDAFGYPTLSLWDVKGETASISAFPFGPNLSLADGRGYSTEIGTTSLVTPNTGETHQTSAASIVMFGNGKKHHVIWEAP